MSGFEHPDAIEAIAARVVELLEPRVAALIHTHLNGPSNRNRGLINPAELAEQLGRSTDWVRDHADELGVIRLGTGDKPRLLFDRTVVDERLRAQAAQCTSARRPPAYARARRHQEGGLGAAHLLPIGGKR